MAKTIKPPDNVTIINPDTEETTTTNDMSAKPTTETKAPKTGGKIHKCPKCSAVIHHRAITCKPIDGSPSCGAVFLHEEHIIEAGSSPTTGKTRAKKQAKTQQTENPQVALLKVLKGRGFEVSGTRDIFDPTAEITYTTEKAIQPILTYVPNYKANGKFELSLDELLTVLKLPLNK